MDENDRGLAAVDETGLFFDNIDKGIFDVPQDE
jgi:hypothetical protein